MARKFVYDGKDIQDPDPNMAPEDVRQWAAEFYPELSNAETKVSKSGDDTVYTFNKRVGTKGAAYTVEVEIPDGLYCWDEENGQRACPFLNDDGLGDYGCNLQKKPGLEGQYSGRLPKFGECPSLKNQQPVKLEGPLSDDRG